MDGFQAETESGVQKAFKHVAEVAAGAFAAHKLFDFGKDIVKGAAQVQKSTEQIRAGFGSASESVIKFNETAAAKLGLSAAAGDSAAAKFSLLFKNLGIGERQSATMTIGFEKLATSLASIKGIDPSEVMDKFTAAAAGSTRGLKSLGIVIDSNAIKQEALRLGLLKTASASDTNRIADLQIAIAKANLTAATKKYGDGTTQVATAQIALQKAQAKANAESAKVVGTLTPAAKAQAIYALATKDLGTFQAQAHKHSGDLIDVQRRLRAEYSNIKDELGAKLLPVVARVGGYVADKLPLAFKTAKDAAQLFGDVVRDHLAGPFNTVRDRAREVGEKLQGMLPSLDSVKEAAKAVAGAMQQAVNFTVQWQNVLLPLGGALGSMTLAIEAWTVATEVWSVATTIATAVQEAFNIAMDANPIAIIILAIVGLIGAMVMLYQRSATVRDMINLVWTSMRTAAVETWGAIRDYVVTAAKVIRDLVVGFFQVMRIAVTTEWNLIRIVITTVLKVLRDVFNIFIDLVTFKWGKAWKDIRRLVTDVLSGISSFFSTWWHGFVGIISAYGTTIKRVFRDVWQGVGDTFTAVGHWLEQKAIQIVLKVIEPFSHIPRWLGGGWAQDMKASLTTTLDGLRAPAANSGAAVGTSFGQALGASATAAVNTAVDAMKASLGSLSGLLPGAGATPHGPGSGGYSGGSGTAGGGGKMSSQQIYKLLIGAGFSPNDAANFVGIAMAESGGRSGVLNNTPSTGDYSIGLFQENFFKSLGPARTQRYAPQFGLSPNMTPERFVAWLAKHPAAQARIAADLFSSSGYSPWAGDAYVKAHPELLSGGGGGGGGGTGMPDLTVGGTPAKTAAQRAAEHAAKLKEQIAAAKKTLEESYRSIAKTAKELGSQMSKHVKEQMADVRADISHVSSKADVAKARAELRDLHTAVADALKKMRQDLQLHKTFDGLKQAVSSLHDNVTPLIRSQMKEIQSEIGNVTTPAELAKIRSQMAKVKAEVKAGLAAVKKQLSDDKALFEKTWSELASGADKAFDRATTKMLRDLQINVQGAFDSFTFGGSIDKTPTEIALQELQDAHDAATAQAQLAADEAQLAADKASGDKAAIAASAQKVADDLYGMKVASMQKQAKVERDAATQQLQDAQTAFQEQRDLLKQQMDERVALIEKGMEDGSISAASGMKQLAAIFGDPAYGIDVKNSGLILGGNLYAGLQEGLAPVFKLIKRLQDEMRRAGIKVPGGATVPGGDRSSVSESELAAAGARASAIPLDTAIATALRSVNEPLLEELQRQTEIAQQQLEKPTSPRSDTAAIAFAARR